IERNEIPSGLGFKDQALGKVALRGAEVLGAKELRGTSSIAGRGIKGMGKGAEVIGKGAWLGGKV
ncbi:unnamed protein product, partial [Ilex paraguariensis]